MQNGRTATKKGLQSRLIRVFAVQASLVSLATILGVYAAYTIVEDYLVHEALRGEAQHYWQLYENHPDTALPDTRNMTGYLATRSLPDELKNLPKDFFGRVPMAGKSPLVMVDSRPGNTLYLVFREEQVSRLALVFGVAPLTIVLILIYSASWFTFRQSQRLISPITQLARIVSKAGFSDNSNLEQEISSFMGIDADIDSLSSALTDYTSRIQLFIERERSFTRDASHELRTPLAVLKGSLDILQQQKSHTEQQEKVLERMRITINSMENLIETLLLLAHERRPKLEQDPLWLSDIVEEAIDPVREALNQNEVQVQVSCDDEMSVTAPRQVISILVTNLLRNALQYGKQQPVSVHIHQRSLTVSDQGEGMDNMQMEQAFRPFYRVAKDGKGHGLGLTIVKRLCDDYQWTLSAISSPGAGTSVSIDFSPNPESPA